MYVLPWDYTGMCIHVSLQFVTKRKAGILRVLIHMLFPIYLQQTTTARIIQQ